jgi:hypothetical protein
MKNIKQLVGIESTAIADLIQNHQDIFEKDDKICEEITTARHSLEFFMALHEDARALYEAKNIKEKLLHFLGLA